MGSFAVGNFRFHISLGVMHNPQMLVRVNNINTFDTKGTIKADLGLACIQKVLTLFGCLFAPQPQHDCRFVRGKVEIQTIFSKSVPIETKVGQDESS